LISFFRLVLSLSVGAELAANVKVTSIVAVFVPDFGVASSFTVTAASCFSSSSSLSCSSARCGDEVLELKCLVVGLAHDFVSQWAEPLDDWWDDKWVPGWQWWVLASYLVEEWAS
jgi:hypothetical protein